MSELKVVAGVHVCDELEVEATMFVSLDCVANLYEERAGLDPEHTQGHTRTQAAPTLRLMVEGHCVVTAPQALSAH